MKKIKLLTVVLVISLVGFGISTHFSNDDSLPIFGPEYFPFASQENQHSTKTHVIAPFSFIDQNNQVITDNLFKNHITVVSFFYSYCNNICPVIIKRLHDVQSNFNDQAKLKILSISITPMIDTIDILKQFAIENDIDGNQWHLLNGPIDSVIQLAQQSFFGQPSLKRNIESNIHTETIFLVDQKKRIRGIYNSSSRHEISLLKKDIQELL